MINNTQTRSMLKDLEKNRQVIVKALADYDKDMTKILSYFAMGKINKERGMAARRRLSEIRHASAAMYKDLITLSRIGRDKLCKKA